MYCTEVQEVASTFSQPSQIEHPTGPRHSPGSGSTEPDASNSGLHAKLRTELTVALGTVQLPSIKQRSPAVFAQDSDRKPVCASNTEQPSHLAHGPPPPPAGSVLLFPPSSHSAYS